MPSAAWIAAAKRTPMEPVFYCACESVDAVNVTQNLASDWNAGTLINAEVFSLDSNVPDPYDPTKTYLVDQIVKGADNQVYLAMVDVPVSSPPPNATYWLSCGGYSGVRPKLFTYNNAQVSWASRGTATAPASSPWFNPPVSGFIESISAGWVASMPNPGRGIPSVGNILGVDTEVDSSNAGKLNYYIARTKSVQKMSLISLGLFSAGAPAPVDGKSTTVDASYGTVTCTLLGASYGVANVYPANDSNFALNFRTRTASITTAPFDLGVVPNLPSRLQIDHMVTGASSIVYTAQGSTTGTGGWVDLGTVIDGGEIAPYRYYRITATMISSGYDTPALYSIRVVGGNSQYVYFGDHIGEPALPIGEVKPYLQSVSTASAKIALKDKPTVGALTMTLAWMPLTSDLVQSTGKRRSVTVYLGFVGLAAADYEPYFTGVWDGYSADHEKRTFTVKLRDVWQKFKKPIPDQPIVNGQNAPISCQFGEGTNGTAADGSTAITGNPLNIIDAIVQVADLAKAPDRFIDRDAFAALKASSFPSPEWDVFRVLTEQKNSDDLLLELSVTAGVFIVPAPNGKLTPLHYDTLVAQTPAVTLDAAQIQFANMVPEDMTDTGTRYNIYFNVGDDAQGKRLGGGNPSDYRNIYTTVGSKASVVSERDRDEVIIGEWYDNWGLATGVANGVPNALTKLADRLSSWYTPIANVGGRDVSTTKTTVQALNVPLRYYADVMPGKMVLVNNLRLPCPIASWEGFSDHVRFMVLSWSVDPKNFTLKLDLFQIADLTYTTAPTWYTYDRWGVFPQASNLALGEQLVLNSDGSIGVSLAVGFNFTSDYRGGYYEIWTTDGSPNWVLSATVPVDSGRNAASASFIVREGVTYRVAVVAVNSRGRRQSINDAPQASRTILGKTAPPPSVRGFCATVKSYQIELSWQDVNVLDLDYYEIRTGDSWDAGDVLARVKGLSYQFQPAVDEIRLMIRAKDTSGNYSAEVSAADGEVQAQIDLAQALLDQQTAQAAAAQAAVDSASAAVTVSQTTWAAEQAEAARIAAVAAAQSAADSAAAATATAQAAAATAAATVEQSEATAAANAAAVAEAARLASVVDAQSAAQAAAEATAVAQATAAEAAATAEALAAASATTTATTAEANRIAAVAASEAAASAAATATATAEAAAATAAATTEAIASAAAAAAAATAETNRLAAVAASDAAASAAATATATAEAAAATAAATAEAIASAAAAAAAATAETNRLAAVAAASNASTAAATATAVAEAAAAAAVAAIGSDTEAALDAVAAVAEANRLSAVAAAATAATEEATAIAAAESTSSAAATAAAAAAATAQAITAAQAEADRLSAVSAAAAASTEEATATAAAESASSAAETAAAAAAATAQAIASATAEENRLSAVSAATTAAAEESVATIAADTAANNAATAAAAAAATAQSLAAARAESDRLAALAAAAAAAAAETAATTAAATAAAEATTAAAAAASTAAAVAAATAETQRLAAVAAAATASNSAAATSTSAAAAQNVAAQAAATKQAADQAAAQAAADIAASIAAAELAKAIQYATELLISAGQVSNMFPAVTTHPNLAAVKTSISGGLITLSWVIVADPTIVGYEVLAAAAGGSIASAVSLAIVTVNNFTTPFNPDFGRYYVRVVYTSGPSISNVSFVDLTPLPVIGNITVAIVEPNIEMTWPMVPGAVYYSIILDYGVGMAFQQTATTFKFPIPARNVIFRVRAVMANGTYTQWGSEEVDPAGAYQWNEVLTFSLPAFDSGNFVNMVCVSGSEIQRPSIAGGIVAAPYASSVNDSDLWNSVDKFTMDVSALNVDVGWFRDKWWRTENAWFESAAYDLGSICTGRLSIVLASSMTDYTQDVANITWDVAEFDYLQVEELSSSAVHLTAKIQISTDNVNWSEVNNGDWVIMRYCRLVVSVLHASPLVDIVITSGQIVLDVPDQTESRITPVTGGAVALNVLFSKPFNKCDYVECAATIKAWATNITKTGFTINLDSNPGTTNVYWFAKGY